MATTIVNSPPASNPENSDNSSGLLLGLVLLILLVIIFFVFGLPSLQRATAPSAQVNVPDHVNVNLQQSGTKY